MKETQHNTVKLQAHKDQKVHSDEGHKTSANRTTLFTKVKNLSSLEPVHVS